MSFTSFLGKVGKALAEGVSIALGVGPIIFPFLGSKVQGTATTVINDLTSVGQVVTMTEAILQGPGNGADKLAAATPLVANIVQTSELVAGHRIANESLFIQGCQKITSGVADILNALDPGAVQTSGKPLPVPAQTQIPAQTPVSVTTATPAAETAKVSDGSERIAVGEGSVG